MQLWVASNGVKQGPVPDYEVRGKIESGEYGPETMAWHEGLDGWVPLSQMSIFEREFAKTAEPPVEKSEEIGVNPLSEQKTTESYRMRRFWARWLDLHGYTAIWWLGLYAAHADIGAVIHNPWLMLFLYLPWVPIEGWLISRTGTTPGKWLLGLKVVEEDGSMIKGPRSMRRALRVYFLGIGMGWSLVAAICQAMSWFHVRSVGKTIWDLHAGHRVEAKPWHWFRGSVYMVGLIAAMQMQWVVIAPYMIEDVLKRYPEMRPWIEKNPPQHLPRRDGQSSKDS